MDPASLKELIHNLEVNDSVWKIADLTRLRRYEQLDSSEIKNLADPSLSEILALLDQFGNEEVKYLVTQWLIKSEVMGMVLVYLGPEKLKYCIPELLEYLQDLNWPAAGYVGIVLRKMPSDLMVPEIIQVIEKNHHDETWVSWICSELISSLKQTELYALKTALIKFIYAAKEEDIVEAAKVLIPVLSSEEFTQLSQYFTNLFAGNPPAISEVMEWKDGYHEYHQSK